MLETILAIGLFLLVIALSPLLFLGISLYFCWFFGEFPSKRERARREAAYHKIAQKYIDSMYNDQLRPQLYTYDIRTARPCKNHAK